MIDYSVVNYYGENDSYGQMDPEGSWPTGAETSMASDWTPLAVNDATYLRMMSAQALRDERDDPTTTPARLVAVRTEIGRRIAAQLRGTA